jgi:hypothetical protein
MGADSKQPFMGVLSSVAVLCFFLPLILYALGYSYNFLKPMEPGFDSFTLTYVAGLAWYGLGAAYPSYKLGVYFVDTYSHDLTDLTEQAIPDIPLTDTSINNTEDPAEGLYSGLTEILIIGVRFLLLLIMVILASVSGELLNCGYFKEGLVTSGIYAVLVFTYSDLESALIGLVNFS